jgi:hypothetical protein
VSAFVQIHFHSVRESEFAVVFLGDFELFRGPRGTVSHSAFTPATMGCGLRCNGPLGFKSGGENTSRYRRRFGSTLFRKASVLA